MTRPMISLFLAAFLCFQSCLFSHEDLPEELIEKGSEPLLGIVDVTNHQPSNLTSLESEPSASILGCVSVISGDYTDTAIDYVVPGPDPLPIQRIYSSGELRNGSICFGTSWGKSGVLYRLKIENKKTETHAIIIGGGGARMRYVEEGYHDYKLHKQCSEKGLINTAFGTISGRTDPLNDKLVSDKKKNWFTLTSGGGVVSEFKRFHDESFFLLQDEKKPNGLKFVYNYDSKNRLKGIALQNRHGRNLASYTTEHYDYAINIKTDNNRHFSYEFEKLKTPDGKKYYLKNVRNCEKPLESFEYASYDSKTAPKLVKKKRPDGRAIGVEYFEKGVNEIPFGCVDIADREDPRFGRVKAIKAPVGYDPSLQYIYKFKYYINSNWVFVGNGRGAGGSDYVQEFRHGDTSVYDVYNRLTKYFYNEDYRLTSVEKFQGTGPSHSLYSKEKLFWNGHKIAVRTFETKEGWTQYARQYDYDSRGNIWRDTLWGNLSGYNTEPILYPPTGYPEYNGCEIDFKLFTYSDDGLNLMTSMTEGKTAHTTYHYHPGTDLLAAKLTGPIGSIALREFSEYDENGSLVLYIQDDGTTPNKDDLTGVTLRQVKRILPTTSCPVGLPLITEEKYVDLETGYEGFIQKIVHAYTPEGWLSRKEVYDQNCDFAYAERWEYDEHGNVILYEDPAGRITTKAYDANFNLVFDQGPCQDIHTEFHYDFSDRLVKKEFVCKNGPRLSEEYIYDLRSNLVATRDSYGNQTCHTYDEFDRRIKTTFPTVLDENGHPYSPELKVGFNELSHPTETTDCRGFLTEKKFTVKGAPYKVCHPDGSVDRFVYNVDGTVQKQFHKNGSYTIYEYDYQKRPTKKEVYSSANELIDATYSCYSGFKLLKETTLSGSDTYYFYDARGRLIEKKLGGLRIAYSYDSMGRLSKTKTYYGPKEGDFIAETSSYDVLNRVIEEGEEDSSGNLLKKWQYEYDLAGNRSRIIEHSLDGVSITSTTYDSYAQPLEIIDAEGNKTVIRYDYAYRNPLGQLVSYQEVTDSLGNVTATMKDALGRIASIVKRNSMGHEVHKVALFYDANGNKSRQVDTVRKPDASTHEVVNAWEYDACNRVVSVIEGVGTPEQKHTQYLYNSDGKKESVIKPDGVRLYFTYDPLGRMLAQYSSDGTFSYRYTYDVRGNVTQVEDLVTGNLTTRRYNDDDHLLEETLGNGLSLSFTYDAMGRPLSMTLPDASSVRYNYQAKNLKDVQRYDKNGTPTFQHTYENYDLGGRLLEEKHAGAAGTSSYAYDILRRLKSHSSDSWNEVNLCYDKTGNLISKATEDAVGVIPSEFEYDDLYQVKKESGVTEAVYEWDSLYNRVSKNQELFTYNALNQLIHDGVSSYEYDFNGNLVKVSSNGDSVDYAYDALDRLVKFSKGGEQYRYTYDDLNRRLTKSKYVQIDGSWQRVCAERFIYQANNEIGSFNMKDELSQFRMLGVGKGAELGASVLIELMGDAFAPLHDHNGNIVSLVNAVTGRTFETYRYTAFGEKQLYNVEGESIGSSINPWGFSSKRLDEETGFVYFGRRYYNPELARWVTADPISFEGGPNLYAYVLNNPLTHFDLYGLLTASSFGSSLNSFANSSIHAFGAAMQGGINAVRSGVGAVSHSIGAAMDYWGLALVPIPSFQDTIRSVGMFLQNKGSKDWKSWRENKSSASDLGRPEIDPNMSIVLGGGVDTPEETMRGRALQASDQIGGKNVGYFYNSTHGIVADTCEWLCQRLGIYTRSVKRLAQECRTQIAKMGGVDGGGFLYLPVHSQSGEIANGLSKYLTPKELKMIHVRTFGSPVQISEDHFGSAINYISESDYVPMLNHLRGSRPNTNTVILPSNAWCEHSWDCQTYQNAFYRDLKNTMEKRGIKR